jgi:hypothetical protein
MEQSPSENLILHLACQEIPRLLWNPKIHYRVQNSLPPVPILSQMNQIHTLQPFFLTFHFNIILPSSSVPSDWSHPFRLSNEIYK